MKHKKRNRWVRFGAFLLALVSLCVTANLHAQNVQVGSSDQGSLYVINGSGGSSQPIVFTKAGATVSASANCVWNGTITMSAAGTFKITTDSSGSSSSALTVNGVLSGKGNFIKTGGGTFLLNSASTLTGTTFIQEGTFAVGADGEILGGTAIVMSSGTLLDLSEATKNQTIQSLCGEGEIDFGTANISLTLGADGTDTTFAGMITGTGEIIKTGSGTFTFDGDLNSFTGTFTVNEGTLSGWSDFGTVVVEKDAIFAPGDRNYDYVSDVSVENLELKNESILNLRVDDAGGNDQVKVDNAPTIGSDVKLEIDAIAGDYDYSQIYGDFIVDSLGNDLTDIDQLSVSVKQKFLDVNRIGTTNTLEISRNTNFFTNYGQTHNQRAVGRMLDRVATSGPWTAMTQLSQSTDPAAIRAAYNEIASDLRANSLMLGQWRTSRYGLSHLDLTRCGESQENGVWFEVIHQSTNFDNDGNSSDYNISRTGFLIGSEERREETTFGMLVGYSKPYIHERGNKVDVGDFQLGFYGGARIRETLEMKIYIGYGHQSYDFKRVLRSPLLIDPDSTSNRITGEASGDSMPMSLEFALPLQGGMFSFRPVLAIDSDLTWQYGFREQGDTGLELAYNRAFYDRTFLRIGCTMQLGSVENCTQFSLLGRFYYGYQLFGDSHPTSKARFLTEPSSNMMKVYGVDMGKSEFNFGLGLRWNVDSNRAFYGDYDLLLADETVGHYGSIGYVQKW